MYEKANTGMTPALSMPVQLADRRADFARPRSATAVAAPLGGTVMTLLSSAVGGCVAPSNEPPDLTA